MIKQLLDDAEFGLEKAMNERGISTSLMYNCCDSWLKVLEIEEQFFQEGQGYENFFKQVIDYCKEFLKNN